MRRWSVTTAVLAVAMAAPATAQVRVFMSRDGEEYDAPTTGPTMLHMQPCETVDIGVWIEGVSPGQSLKAYQILLPWSASATAATGSVDYVDIDSGTACNVKTTEVVEPDLSMQGQSCVTAADCCPPQNRCTWCECNDGTCNVLAIRTGDAGGPYDDCVPDGFTNLHDYAHPLDCWLVGSLACTTPSNMDFGTNHGTFCGSNGFCNVTDANICLEVFAVGPWCGPCSTDIVPSNARSCFGESVMYDDARPDALFGPSRRVFRELVPPPNHTAGFGLVNWAFDAVAVSGIAHVAQFSMTASADASGSFELAVIPEGDPDHEGGTFFLSPGTDFITAPYDIAEYQPLTIVVGAGGAAGTLTSDCCDADGNAVADDVCQWCTVCADGTCASHAKAVPADIGGPFGDCVPDGFCNVHDANLARAAFAGTTTCAAINLDAGGPFGACAADGFTNVHDVNHALACFEGTSTCSCSPAPEAP